MAIYTPRADSQHSPSPADKPKGNIADKIRISSRAKASVLVPTHMLDELFAAQAMLSVDKSSTPKSRV